jgi:hypothetical protein
MADDLKQTRKTDDSRINVEQDHECDGLEVGAMLCSHWPPVGLGRICRTMRFVACGALPARRSTSLAILRRVRSHAFLP